jgi:hypothetical protein
MYFEWNSAFKNAWVFRTSRVAVLAVCCCMVLTGTTVHAHRNHRQNTDNGIHVGQPKVYDSRELTLMLDNLSRQLQGTNFINPGNLASALGNIQGYQNSDFSASLFANGAVGPGAAGVFAGTATAAAATTSTNPTTPPTVTINVGSASPTATPATSTAATLGPQAPGLPTLQTPPTYTPTFGSNGSDLLSDEVNLTYQVYNLSMLLDRSLTDRVYHHDSRLEAVMGFDIDLEPDENARDAAAVVEVEITMKGCDSLSDPAECAAGEKPGLFALMPEEGSHNAATLSQSAVGFGGAVAAAVFSAGVSAQKRNQVFYLYRDMDTVSFQRPGSTANSVDFGWQFRPVLGRHSIESGIRHLMVVIGLPAKDVQSKMPTLDVKVTTKWERYYPKHQTTSDAGYFWRDLPKDGGIAYPDVAVPTSLQTQNDLGAWISKVDWIPTDPANGVAVVSGKNFFPGTTVQLGPKSYQSAKDGLILKSDKELEISVPLAIAVSGGVLSGRYGKAVALQSEPDTVKAGGIQVSNLRIVPEGNDMEEVSIDLRIRPDHSGDPLEFDSVIRYLNGPVVIIDGKPEPGTPQIYCQPLQNSAQCQTNSDGSQNARLTVFVPSKDIAKGAQVTVAFPFEGPEWKDTVLQFDPTLKVVRLGGDTEARLLISSTNAGDRLCTDPWALQLQDGAEIPLTPRGFPIHFPKPEAGKPDLRGSSLECVDRSEEMLSFEISAKTLKPYHHFLLVNRPTERGVPPQPSRVGDIPPADPAPPAPSLDKDQKVTVAQNSTKIITFTGKHLDQITKVLFDKIPLNIVSVAVKKGAILAGLWPCFSWQQLLPAFPRAAARTIRFCAFPSSVARVWSSRRRANLPAW